MLSATLHAVVVALALLLSYSVSRDNEDVPKVFELVAGEGDNYMAREAPALGTPGVKLNLPTKAAPKTEFVPPAPEPLPVAPIKPAPVATPPKPADQPIPDFSKKIKRDIIVADSKVKREIAKKRAAEAKQKAAEAKRQAEEDRKRLSKEEFDRLNKSKSQPSTSKSAPTKVAKIDAEGIAKGVVGGSRNNKTGGAGGKALTNNNEDVLGAYFALFKERVRREFELPPGVSESLQVEIEFRSHPDGTLSNPRVIKSSGSRDFDRAVLDAMKRVKMPVRPDKKTEEVTFIFEGRERDER